MDIFKLGDKILALLEAVFGFWNNQISLVFAMLGQSPVSFKGGGPWAVIEGIEPVFVAVGSSLVVLFFVIGFCSESIDVKDEMRFESIFRMLIRLGLAEWFVANNVTIMKAFFTSIGNLVGLISAGTTTQLAIDSTQADIIKGLGFGESLVMLILTALLAIIIIICGFFIIYTVYFRFLKILIIVPGDITITSHDHGKDHNLALNSNFCQMSLTGQFNYHSILTSMKNIVAKHIQSLPGTTLTYEKKHSNNFTMCAKISDTRLLRKLTGANFIVDQPSGLLLPPRLSVLLCR